MLLGVTPEAGSEKASGMETLLIVSVEVLVPRFAPVTLSSCKTIVSAGSGNRSGVIRIGIFFAVSPAAKFSTPSESLKSMPLPAAVPPFTR